MRASPTPPCVNPKHPPARARLLTLIARRYINKGTPSRPWTNRSPSPSLPLIRQAHPTDNTKATTR